jgi:hypothetical protein
MYTLRFHTRPDGKQPARAWINAQDNSIKPNIYRKLDDLRIIGLDLLKTNSMDIISGTDKGLYELRNRSLGWRIAVYHDVKNHNFILLHGWHKDNNYAREIQKARGLLIEYFEMENKRNAG